MLLRVLDAVRSLVDAHVALGFTLDAHQTVADTIVRGAAPSDELAVAPLVKRLPALEPIDPFSPRRAQQAGATVMWSAHGGGDHAVAASMYGRHLRRFGYLPPICLYFRRDDRIVATVALLRRDPAPPFEARIARLLSEWQPFLQDALTLPLTPPEAPKLPPLTAREAAVAAHVANGSTNADIAAALGLTEGTVKAHLTRVYAKLGVRNRTQLAVTLPAARDGAQL